MLDVNAGVNTGEGDTATDTITDGFQIPISVHVSKPSRGYSDVTLTDSANDHQVLHQDRIRAGDVEDRKQFLDDAVDKYPGLDSLRDPIDSEISQQRFAWDKGAEVSGDAANHQGKFSRHDNGIVWDNRGKPTALCNFYAEIVNDVVVTDGVDDQRYFEVRVETDGRGPQIRLIPASEFDSLEWVSRVGSWYTLAGDVARCNKLVAEAIRSFSLTHGEKVHYAHTGWIKQDGKMKFLTASGALGVDGLDESLKTELEGDTDHLSYYKLVAPPEKPELAEAVRSTLRLLELSRDRSKTWPLIGTLYATPVLALDYSIFCSGRTGAFKTSTQRLFMAHLGVAWCDRPLPTFKNATRFGLEQLQFAAKDLMLPIDDYQRTSTRASTEKMNNLVQSVFQTQADRGGRVKGNADGSRHSVKPPRCSLISNGEDVVPGLSTTARQLVISFQAGDIDKDLLTECQEAAAAGRYVQAYSGFISWVADNYELFRKEAAARQLAYRKTFSVEGQHGRTAENLAQAMVGIDLYLSWCKTAGAIDDTEHDRLQKDALATLQAIGTDQRAEQDRQDPVTTFLESILEALASGWCHVTRTDGSAPSASPNIYGWARNENGDCSRWDPKGPCVGYLDSNGNLCLMLKTALTVLQKDSPAGEMLTIGHVELGKQLAKADKIVKDAAGNSTRPVKVAGSAVRLTCIKAEALQPLVSTPG